MDQYDRVFKEKWVANYDDHKKPKREVRIVTKTGILVFEAWEADLSPELADRLVQEHNNYLDLKAGKKKGGKKK